MQHHEQITRPPYPALWLACFFGWGCLIASNTSAPITLFIGCFIGCGSIAQWSALSKNRRLVSLHPLTWTLTLMLAIASLGAARYRSYHQRDGRSVNNVARMLENKANRTSLRGVITSFPKHHAGRIRFDLNHIHLNINPQRTLPLEGRIRLSITTSEHRFNLAIGDTVQARGALKATTERRNPAEFDYGKYQNQRGVQATLNIYNT
jgi:hypothetical protein